MVVLRESAAVRGGRVCEFTDESWVNCLSEMAESLSGRLLRLFSAISQEIANLGDFLGSAIVLPAMERLFGGRWTVKNPGRASKFEGVRCDRGR